MSAQIIDGKAIALQCRKALKGRVKEFVEQYGHAPGLGVVQPQHQAQQGRLAAPRRTDERDLRPGRDVDVEGAIADIQLRAGLALAEPTEAFLGLRYLGGGASGTGTPDGGGDGYTENWLHFLTLTLGARVR